MTGEVKKKTPVQSLDYGERKEKSKEAVRELFNEARKLDETGVSQSLDHGKAQAAKDYYPRWRRERREGIFLIATVAAALLFFFTRPGNAFSMTGNEKIDGAITVVGFLVFWVAFYFVAEKDLPKIEYVKRMLGPIPQVGKREEQDRYYRGLRFHIFGEREDVFQRWKFAFLLGATALFALAAAVVGDEILSYFFASLAAMVFFAANVATYWKERKIDESNGVE